MNIVVQKFGGTSVATVERIAHIANKIIQHHISNHRIVVVVSAMAGVTSTLLNYCRNAASLTTAENLRLADAVISNGENITSGLMALALREQGIKAVSLQAWQVPINTTDDAFGALITSINKETILQYLQDGIVPVITGFQGIGSQNQITTLGRGGSDITAAAIAASIGAVRCDIYTDVACVYSADPRIVADANKISRISYNSMLELSYCGAKVLHPRSVEIAKEFALDLRVISSFDEEEGTRLMEGNQMELSKSVGISQNKNILLAKITTNIRLLEVLEQLAHLDIFVQNSFVQDGHIMLIASIAQFNKLDKMLAQMLQAQTIANFHIQTDLSIISVIGNKLLNEQHLITKILQLVKNYDILWLQLEHSKITMLAFEQDCDHLAKILHDALL